MLTAVAAAAIHETRYAEPIMGLVDKEWYEVGT